MRQCGQSEEKVVARRANLPEYGLPFSRLRGGKREEGTSLFPSGGRREEGAYLLSLEGKDGEATSFFPLGEERVQVTSLYARGGGGKRELPSSLLVGRMKFPFPLGRKREEGSSLSPLSGSREEGTSLSPLRGLVV